MKLANSERSPNRSKPVSPNTLSPLRKTPKTLVIHSQDLPRLTQSRKFPQDSLVQACKIYRNTEKIFTKLLDNHRIVEKLQKAFSNILQEELYYIKATLQKQAKDEEASQLAAAIVHNLSIFKENLKLFSNLIIEDQYEEVVTTAKKGIDLKTTKPVNGYERASQSIVHTSLQHNQMERIEEEEAEQVAENSERPSSNYTDSSLASLLLLNERKISKQKAPKLQVSPFEDGERKKAISLLSTSNEEKVKKIPVNGHCGGSLGLEASFQNMTPPINKYSSTVVASPFGGRSKKPLIKTSITGFDKSE